MELGHALLGVKFGTVPLSLHKTVARGHWTAIFCEILTEFSRDGEDRDKGGAEYGAAFQGPSG
ncbi:MAG: hypothetical protein ACREC0_09195 [Methylocella sp.]